MSPDHLNDLLDDIHNLESKDFATIRDLFKGECWTKEQLSTLRSNLSLIRRTAFREWKKLIELST